MFRLIIGFILFSVSLCGFAQESEATRIAREHQPGGLYNPNSKNNNGTGKNIKLPDIWGAIAIDNKTYKGGGTSFNVLTEKEAKGKALGSCAKYSSTCKVIATYKTNQCAAVAAADYNGNRTWVVEVASSREVAGEKALAACDKKFKKVSGVSEGCQFWIRATCGLESQYLNLNK